MDLGQATLQWLHILFGTFWFGGALFANFVVVPVMMRLPAEPQQQFFKLFAAQSERMMLIAASGTILLGFLRGTVFGSIRDLAALSTPYGTYWLIGLVAASLTYAYGTWFLSPRANRVLEMAAVGVGPGGQISPELAAAINRLKVVALLELVGFFVVFTMMIAMHFAGAA
ncbi:MAG: hypothetical protein HYX54_00785 [Chloroflexi bacterium]|nr:hypothetical protein [Chloroflexota bacterium]